MKFLFLIAMLMAAPGALAENVISVGAGADCLFDDLNSAVAAAQSGDIILVQKDYVHSGEEVRISNQSLEISGGLNCRPPFVAEVAEIRAAGANRVFKIDADPATPQTVSLFHLVITGGRREDSHGGGIYVTGGARVNLRNVEISGNRAYNGGGIAVETGAQVTTDDRVQISGNEAVRDGGGVFIDGAEFVFSGGNVASNLAANGAGLSCIRNATLDFQFGAVLANTLNGGDSFALGGGIYAHDCDLITTGNPERSRSVSVNSVVAPPPDGSCEGYPKGLGLGIYVGGSSRIALGSSQSMTVISNQVAPTLVSDDLKFSTIQSAFHRCYDGRGGGMMMTGFASGHLTNVGFFNNQSRIGAGLAMEGEASLTIVGSPLTPECVQGSGHCAQFVGNHAAGYRLVREVGQAQFDSNQHARGQGGAVFLRHRARLELDRVLMDDNRVSRKSHSTLRSEGTLYDGDLGMKRVTGAVAAVREDAALTVINSLVRRSGSSTAESTFGAFSHKDNPSGEYCDPAYNPRIELHHVTVHDDAYQHAIVAGDCSADIDVTNSILLGDGGHNTFELNEAAQSQVSCILVNDSVNLAGVGRLNRGNAGFRHLHSGDYRPGATSDAVDFCSDEHTRGRSANDALGQPRPVDHAEDDAFGVFDIGAYENQDGEVQQIDLSISTPDDGIEAATGRPHQFEVVVNNLGPENSIPGAEVVFTAFSDEMIVQAVDAPGTTYSCQDSTFGQTCRLRSSINNGSSRTFYVTALLTGAAGETATLHAEVLSALPDLDDGNDRTSATVTLLGAPPADFQIDEVAWLDVIDPQTFYRFEYPISSNAGAVLFADVSVVADGWRDLSLLNVRPSGDQCLVSGPAGRRVMNCRGVPMLPSGALEIEVLEAALSDANRGFSIEVAVDYAGDLQLDNNSVTHRGFVRRAADLDASMELVLPRDENGRMIVALRAQNTGPADATQPSVLVGLPLDATLENEACSGGICPLRAIPSHGTETILLELTLPPPAGCSALEVALHDEDSADPDRSNNRATLDLCDPAGDDRIFHSGFEAN